MEDSLSRGHSAGQALEARLPDEITMCKFRHQLKAHEMGTRNPQLIQQQHQAGQSLRPRHGTVLDATSFDAPTPAWRGDQCVGQNGLHRPEGRLLAGGFTPDAAHPNQAATGWVLADMQRTTTAPGWNTPRTVSMTSAFLMVN